VLQKCYLKFSFNFQFKFPLRFMHKVEAICGELFFRGGKENEDVIVGVMGGGMEYCLSY